MAAIAFSWWRIIASMARSNTIAAMGSSNSVARSYNRVLVFAAQIWSRLAGDHLKLPTKT
jgi:hypothetical protein